MSDQPLCERSSRTGVRSTRIGKSAVVRLALAGAGDGSAAGARRRRRRGTSSGCPGSSGPTAAPGRPGSGRRSARRPAPARWQIAPLGPSRAHRVEERGDRLLEPALHQVHEAGERDQPRAADRRRRPGSRSGRARAGTARRGPARTGSRARRRNCSSSSQASSFSARLARATSSRTERSRIAGSGSVIVSIRSWPSLQTWSDDQCVPVEGDSRSARSRRRASACDVLLDPDDRFEQEGEDLLAVDAGQGQGDLGLDDAELDAQVVPGAAGLERQVPLAPGQRVQGRRELDLAQLADVVADQLVEQVEDERASARACRRSRGNARRGGRAPGAAARPGSGSASR